MPTPCVPTVRTPSHFVGAIADYCPVSTPMIPALVVHCANEIEARGLRESGLYRVNVLDRDVRPLKVSFPFAFSFIACATSKKRRISKIKEEQGWPVFKLRDNPAKESYLEVREGNR